jgi:uncharacterized membrane protein (TIGR02234 family)
MRARLPLVAAVAAVGALSILFSAGRTWGSATVTGAAHQHVSVTGRQVSAALSALALALLALAVAAVAARGLLRPVVAVLGVVAGVIAAVVVGQARANVSHELAARAFGVAARSLPAHTNGWWVLALIGDVVASAAFGVVAAAGGRWEGMGARYDVPQSEARRTDPAMAAWEALDRGDDPTA